MPAFGRLVSGIMPATEITSPSRPGMMPDHAGDPGTVRSVLAPHDHPHISHDILQRTICDLPLAIRAYRRFRAVVSWADRGCGDTQMSLFGA
jgi:hypothetical protein